MIQNPTMSGGGGVDLVEVELLSNVTSGWRGANIYYSNGSKYVMSDMPPVQGESKRLKVQRNTILMLWGWDVNGSEIYRASSPYNNIYYGGSSNPTIHILFVDAPGMIEIYA